MTIESLCQRDVVVIDEAGTTRDAARAMREHRVGAIVVVHGEGRAMRLVGIVTDRDIALAVAADGRGCDVAIRTLARRPLVTITRSSSVADATAVMRSAAVRRLVVVDEHRHMVGIVSMDDVLGGVADLLRDLSAGTIWRPEHETVEAGATEPGLLVAPDLAATWRRVIQP